MNTTNTIHERPILFSGPMVRAILEGRKTQTRRVVKQVPHWDHGGRDIMEWGLSGCYTEDGRHWLDIQTEVDDNSHEEIFCPYGHAGDRLWVRETWVELSHTSPATDEPSLCDGDKLIEHATHRDAHGRVRWNYDGRVIAYRATSAVEFCDGDGFIGENADKDDMPRWRPSIHMPRWASRITMEIKAVRCERLQEISPEDCLAEGIDYKQCDPSNAHQYWREEAVAKYRELWDAINGKRHPWQSNPWVWVVECRRLTQ